MTSFRKPALAVSFSLMGAITGPAEQAAPEFVNGLALDGAALDRSGGRTPIRVESAISQMFTTIINVINGEAVPIADPAVAFSAMLPAFSVSD